MGREHRPLFQSRSLAVLNRVIAAQQLFLIKESSNHRLCNSVEVREDLTVMVGVRTEWKRVKYGYVMVLNQRKAHKLLFGV